MSDHWRWAIPPLHPGASRADRREYALVERDIRLEIENVWYRLLDKLRFVHHQGGVPTAVLAWVEPPQIGRVTLGPPTRFTVRPHPGLRREHLAGIDELLASAFGVPAVRISDLPAGWFGVEMVEIDVEPRVDEPLPPVPAEPDDLPPPVHRMPRHRNPLGSRRRRGPTGGPRTMR